MKKYPMPNTVLGLVKDNAEGMMLDANYIYAQILKSGVMMTGVVVTSLLINIMSVEGPGIWNYILLFGGVVLIAAFGFMPLVLAISAAGGGFREVAKDGEDAGFIQGAVNGISWWAKKVVLTVILVYGVLMFDLAVTPYRGHPENFLMMVVASLIVGLVLILVDNKTIHRVLIAALILLGVWSHFHLVPTDAKSSVRDWWSTSSAKTSGCDVTYTLVDKPKFGERIYAKPACGAFEWGRVEGSNGVIEMKVTMIDEDKKNFTKTVIWKQGAEAPNYTTPVVYVQFRHIKGEPVLMGTGILPR